MPAISWKTFMLATAVAASACAVEDDADLGVDSDNILGDTTTTGASFDAIGALGVEGAHGRYTPFCTATLIAPTQVLTSETCAERYPAAKIAFLVGAKARQPRQTVRARGVAAEETLSGGVQGVGSDVAIVHLAAPVTGVSPLPVATLGTNLVHRRFDVVGYGVRDDHGRRDERRRGSMELVGIGDRHYGQRLLDGVEAWFGGDHDDADLCHGDEGSPALRTVGGTLTVFGVASWFPRGCYGGAIYSIVNDAVQGLIARETACPLIPAAGTCDGDVAIRCSVEGEGPLRTLVNDCSTLLQTCGFDATGAVACVDPT